MWLEIKICIYKLQLVNLYICQFCNNNFFSTALDTVHSLYPFQLITSFQMFGNAFRFLYVFIPFIYQYFPLLIAFCFSLLFIITYITYFLLLTFSFYTLLIYSLSLLTTTKKVGARE